MRSKNGEKGVVRNAAWDGMEIPAGSSVGRFGLKGLFVSMAPAASPPPYAYTSTPALKGSRVLFGLKYAA